MTRLRTQRIFFLVVLFALNILLLHGQALADGISGYLELNFNQLDTKTEASGDVTRTKSDSFRQLYKLNLLRTIYPTLTLRADGIFEKIMTKSKTDDLETKTSTTKIRPLIELNLRTTVFNAAAGYSRNEKKDTATGSPEVTNVLEDYRANFGWRPEGLPSVELRLDKAHTFDKERLIQDTETDSIALTLKYTPIKDLDLRYQPSYRDTKDKLSDTETKNINQSGRVTYSASLFNKRVSLLTTYSISHNEVETITTSSAGEVSTQLFPFSGLSAIDDSPLTGALDPNSVLIDGDLTASANIDIGLPSLGGNKSPRNMGLDFINPAELNTLFVWVDRELPNQIAISFSWDIYTSSDDLCQNWNLFTTVAPAAFGLFQNRFEIKFPNVTTRCIKVVTTPLKPEAAIGVPGDFSNIFVTEVQAFLRSPASEAKKKVKTTAHLYEADVKTRILDTPSVFYEFSYFLTRTSSLSNSVSSSELSNGFSVVHRFSGVLSGHARVSRLDTFKEKENGVSYLYNASMTFVPLKTLSHTLTYSGQTARTKDGTSNSNSISLNVIAELYKGINVNMAEGVSFQTVETGDRQKSTFVNFGSSIIPHPKLSLNVNYSKAKTDQSGGKELSTLNSTAEAGVSYRPFETVYLSTSVSRIVRTDKKSTIQNYAVTWSPFREGALQFNFAFNEALTSDEGKSRVIIQSLRWNINRNTYMDMSYQIFKTEAESQKTDTKTSGVTFRMVF